MSLTANGVGSGLDINGLVGQLMALERRPVNQLAAKEGSFQAQLSAFGQFKSSLTPLQTAVNGLKNASSFTNMRASVGEASLATATATSSAAKGSYSLEVLQIAQGQRVLTNETTAPSVAGGSLNFNFGSYQTDNSDPDNPVTSFVTTSSAQITLEPGKDTLEDLRDAINDANAGVRASVVDNGETKQLIIAGNREGAGGAFTMEGTDGLAGFSYDASTGASSSLNLLEEAQDARIRLDGVVLTRGSNSIDDAIEGVTLNLLKGEPGKKTTLTVSNDFSRVKTSIESMVKAYNEFNTASRSLTDVDPEEMTRGILTGDVTARSIQTQLRNVFGTMVASSGGGVSSLSQMGISFNRDGSLTLDSTKLDAALNDPSKKVAEFFSGEGNVRGFAASLADRLDGILGDGGMLASRTEGINSSVRALDQQRERLGIRLEMVEKRYRAQFTSLDAMMGSMMQTSSYLQQQLANLPKIST